MSILIKGMEMPKVPTRVIIFADGRVEDEDDSAYKYSAVHVPPHGRLVDADALVQLFKEKAAEHGGLGGIMVALAAACIDAAPTIIAAEEGE